MNHWTEETLRQKSMTLSHLVHLEVVRHCSFCGERLTVNANTGMGGQVSHLKCLKNAIDTAHKAGTM